MTQSDFNHLLASVNSLSPEQVRQLRQQLDRQIARPTKPTAQTPGKSAKRATPATAKRKPLTADEFNQQLFGAGRIASLPDPALDIDDDDPDDAPVPIKGEPLSETILRESGAEMANAYFVDSSALVKRYVVETGTAWVRGITRRKPSTHIYISLITAVEVSSAVARRRGVTLSAARASSILSRFRKHLAGRYLPSEITPALVSDAMTLANTHRLRAYDAVQLATALDLHKNWSANRLGAFVFISADRALNAAATAEGLAV